MNLDLGNIQFYWRMVTDVEKEKVDIPLFLPFEFKFNASLKLIQQNLPQETIDILEKVYQYDYNVGYLQDGHDLAESYTNDFIDFFQRSIEGKEIQSIFEIGCGGGYLLKQIQKLGNYDVTCLDPSPVAQKNSDCFNVVSTFYPSNEFIKKVDLIIHYDVLEHIENPIDFIYAHKKNLNNEKYILFAVPDCSSYIEIGDISMVLHEHINYFDKESLYLTVESAGFTNICIEQSKYGGVLYCFAENNKDEEEKEIVLHDFSKFETFKNDYLSLQTSMDLFIENALNDKKVIGFYVPLRVLPYISKNKDHAFRFFDDDKGMYRKYFDGFDIPIENFDDLKDNPVDIMIIMSNSFGHKIKNKIDKESLGIDVVLIDRFTKKDNIDE